MNKALVEKLAVQSLVWVDTGLADGREQIFSTSVFAELIIQECAQVAHNKQYKHSPAHTVGDCATAIKEHFGVE
jgi:hypothetical protein